MNRPAATPGAPPAIMQTLRSGGIALLALVAVALALRLFHIGDQAWLDELLMLTDYVRKPLAHTFTAYDTDNQHPLYSLLASVFARVGGMSIAAIRLPAVIFGAVSLGLAWGFARAVDATRREAFLVAALLAVSSHHILYSQNARGYTTLLCLTVIATWAFRRAAAGARGAWVVQAIALALATYTHLTGAFVGVAQVLALLVVRRSATSVRAPLLGVAAGGALALVLHAPMLGDIMRFFTKPRDQAGGPFQWASAQWSLDALLGGLGFGHAWVGATLVVGAAIVGLFGLRSLWQRDRLLVVAMLLPAVLGAAVPLALGRHLWPRFFFSAVIFAAVIAVRGLSILCARFTPRLAVAGGVVLVLALVPIIPRAYGPKQDFAGARDFVRHSAATGEPVFTAGLATWPYEDPVLDAADFRPVRFPDDRPREGRMLDAAATAGNRSWLIYVSPIFMQGREPALWDVIQRRYEVVQSFSGTMAGLDVVVCRSRT